VCVCIHIYLIHCMYICSLRRPRSIRIHVPHARTHARARSPTWSEVEDARLVARVAGEMRDRNNDNNTSTSVAYYQSE